MLQNENRSRIDFERLNDRLGLHSFLHLKLSFFLQKFVALSSSITITTGRKYKDAVEKGTLILLQGARHLYEICHHYQELLTMWANSLVHEVRRVDWRYHEEEQQEEEYARSTFSWIDSRGSKQSG